MNYIITIPQNGKQLDVTQAAKAIEQKYFITYLPESVKKEARDLHQIIGQNMTYANFVDNIDFGHYGPAQLAAIVLDGTVLYKGKPYYSLPAKHAVWALVELNLSLCSKPAI